MADSPKLDAPLPEDEGFDSGLEWWERILAVLAGLAGVGVGGVGIFFSDNQAGTTAILLVGAVFLLMGVQGTRIIKAGKDNVELERRRKRKQKALELVEKAEEQARDDRPDVAAELASAAQIVDPSVQSNVQWRQLSGELYEMQVERALLRVLNSLQDQSDIQGHRINADAFISHVSLEDLSYSRQARADRLVTVLQGDREIEVPVEVKISDGRQVSAEVVRRAVRSLLGFNKPGLLVANAFMTASARNLFKQARSLGFEFVVWRDENDDDELKQALRAVLAKQAA